MSTELYSGASTAASEQDEPVRNNYWALFIAVFAFITVFGNILVCMAVVKERNLRNITNYFIASLAVADLLVGLLVMPGAIYVEVNLGAWYLGKRLCDFWVTLDVMLCTASIFNLCAISLDRLYAVTRPLEYARQRSNQRIVFTIATVWVISFAICCPVLFGINDVPERTPDLCILFNGAYMIWSSVFSFVVPAITMVIVYILVYLAIRNRMKRIGVTENTIVVQNKTDVSDLVQSDDQAREQTSEAVGQNSDPNRTNPGQSNQASQSYGWKMPQRTGHNSNNPVQIVSEDIEANRIEHSRSERGKGGFIRQFSKTTATHNSHRHKFSMRRERKATKTLAIVLGVFLFCWIPFFTLNIMFGACPSCSAPPLFIQFALWIGYINSTMNPIIYTVFNTDFRRAFEKILSCKKN
ncbi:D(2) dopamine receptor-like [Ptychodera flava]|uniref:D(2) dopamine receptor-like n=1 Tax=Ptychodera flava TaxID=63121 RepID=UPI003969EDBF